MIFYQNIDFDILTPTSLSFYSSMAEREIADLKVLGSNPSGSFVFAQNFTAWPFVRYNK